MAVQMYINKLITILKPPEKIYNRGSDQDWISFQKNYNCIFPSDYKVFIDTYGTGSINNFLWILTPYESNKEINIFQKAEVMQLSYNYMKDMFPGEFKYSIYPEEGGLLPWSYTDNGDELYFDLLNESIVVIEARYSNFYEYKMGMIEFLYKLFTKEIKCNAFPNDFINEVLQYNSITI